MFRFNRSILIGVLARDGGQSGRGKCERFRIQNAANYSQQEAYQIQRRVEVKFH